MRGQAEQRDLSATALDQGWERVVVKPAISASSFGTSLLDDPHSDASQRCFETLIASGPVLVQAYLPEIETGEISLIYCGGAFSHAVAKRPRQGDFRVQAEFGGSVEVIDADHALISLGFAALRALPVPATIARIDLVETRNGPMIMELELIEPQLYFELAPTSAAEAASAIVNVT